jgi:hypothetical protein
MFLCISALPFLIPVKSEAGYGPQKAWADEKKIIQPLLGTKLGSVK